MMGDDGEKFGAWPTTWQHCWGEGRWVDRFFEALEANADWLTTTTPSDWLADHAPIGRVYVPTGSYAEMGEWALPATEGPVFAEVLHRAQTEGRPEARWLRGAFWRNFQVKYREINDLHKQMLRTSEKVAAMAPGPLRAIAIDHLQRGQSNDCYWHGLFGGIYISHMRLATYEHLIAAEDLADTASDHLHATELLDLDMDGLDDVRLAGPGQVVTVDLAEGAGIGSWDVRAVRHALGAVLRRRPEAYHLRLRAHEAALVAAAAASGSDGGAGHSDGSDDGGGPGQPPAPEGDGPASIHDLVMAKEPGLADQLHYDPYERRSGLVRFLAPETGPAAWATAEADELGDAVDRPYALVSLEPGRLVATRDATVRSADGDAAVRIVKTVDIGGDRRSPTLALTLSVENRSSVTVRARLGLEWTLTMLGGGGNPSAWWEVDGVRSAHDGHGSAVGISGLSQGNDHIGIAVGTTLSEPADAWWAPVETVSNSESGFERVYQGGGLLLSWPLDLAPGASHEVVVSHVVTTTRDRGAEAIAALSASALSAGA
jgi:hypothetical protein